MPTSASRPKLVAAHALSTTRADRVECREVVGRISGIARLKTNRRCGFHDLAPIHGDAHHAPQGRAPCPLCSLEYRRVRSTSALHPTPPVRVPRGEMGHGAERGPAPVGANDGYEREARPPVARPRRAEYLGPATGTRTFSARRPSPAGLQRCRCRSQRCRARRARARPRRSNKR
jgi:hypothetical protein